MAHSVGLLALVALLHVTSSRGSQESAPRVQIDAEGSTSMMRSEVRRHSPIPVHHEMTGPEKALAARQHVDEALGLLELGEVNCAGFVSPNFRPNQPRNPDHPQLCHLVQGTNSQVAAKLEHAIKRIGSRWNSLAQTGAAHEDKDSLHADLKVAMWDMFFCAKRKNPPCNPMTTNEPKVKASRELLRAHAHEPVLHKAASVLEARRRADAEPSTSVVKEAAEGEGDLKAAEGEGDNKPVKGAAEGEGDKETVKDPVQTADASAYGKKILDRILTAPNVTGKLWEAIHMVDVQSELQGDIVKVKSDEDGNMKKLKHSMLIMHECATMTQCPADDCCTPKTPTQAKYAKARNDAYIAYHTMKEDDDIAKKEYDILLKNIGGGNPTFDHHANGTRKKWHERHHQLHGKHLTECFGNLTWSDANSDSVSETMAVNEDTVHETLLGAEKRCDEIGKDGCKAITCANVDIDCTVRASSNLVRSLKGETSYLRICTAFNTKPPTTEAPTAAAAAPVRAAAAKDDGLLQISLYGVAGIVGLATLYLIVTQMRGGKQGKSLDSLNAGEEQWGQQGYNAQDGNAGW